MKHAVKIPRVASSLTKRRSAMVLASSMIALAVTGCGMEERLAEGPKFDLIDPAQRHPILVSQKPSNLTIHVPKGSSGLTPKSRADVLDFAQRYRASDAGDSRLVIAAPSGSANEVAAMQAVQQVRALLADNGFADGAISVEAYDAAQGSDAAVRVSYMRYVAEGPECGHWPKNVAYEPNNLPMAGIGCATQKNFAAMVANPADLLGPRTVTPRSGERRDVVWDKYQKGEPTASAKNEDGRATTKAN